MNAKESEGQIWIAGQEGKPQFRDLLFHRGTPCFFAFDILFCNGKDWRRDALMDRKQERLLSRVPADSRLKYVDHVDGAGTALCSLTSCKSGHLRPMSPKQVAQLSETHYAFAITLAKFMVQNFLRFSTSSTQRF